MLYICDADGPSKPTLDFIDDPYGKPSPNNPRITISFNLKLYLMDE